MSSSHPDEISRDYVPLLASSVVFTVLSTIFVLLRCSQRTKINSFWWDDWTIITSLVFAISMMITTVLGGTHGRAGYSRNTYSPTQLDFFSKIFLANNVLYNWSIMSSKISILFFCHRIFSVNKVLRRGLQCIGAALIANCMAASFGLIFSNNPIQGQWDHEIKSSTINRRVFWIATGAINLVFDLLVLATPLAKIRKKHVPSQQKIAVYLLLLLGLCVCILTAVRLGYVSRMGLNNMTRECIVPGIWTSVETNVSILCACLPVIYALCNGTRTGGGAAEATFYQRESVPSSDKLYLELGSGAHISYPPSYHVRVQSPSVISKDDLTPLGPIRVERSYGVSIGSSTQ